MRRLSCIALAVMLAAPAMAQELDPKNSRDQLQRYLNVLATCETEPLADIIDPAVSSFGLRGQFAQSRPLYVQAVEAQCRMGIKLKAKPTLLRQTEFGDTSIAALEVKGNTDIGGRATPVDLRLTLVLHKAEDGVWRIVHSQTATAF